MDTLADQVNAVELSGTPSFSITSTTLLAKVVRIPKHESVHHKNEIAKVPRSHRFLECLNQSIPLTSGSTTYTNVLTGLTGKISFLYFIIRPSAYS